MPEAFYKEHCLDYHQFLQDLNIDTIEDGENEILSGIKTYHMPGHTPDSLALMINEEAIIVGDILLPEISPIPTRVSQFYDVSEIIGPDYNDPKEIFGLCRYIRSLKKLNQLANQHQDLIVFPGHRLYDRGHWNTIHLSSRVNELIEHHIQRCASILDILKQHPMTDSEIANNHFEQNLLKGVGRHMAINEINSHCELLISAGDVISKNDASYELTDNNNFETFIKALPIG